MNNPYKIDQDAFQKRTKQAQEVKLISLKDDSSQPPSTIATQAWQGMILGPAAGQPGRGSSDVKPNLAKKALRVFFWIWAVLLLFGVLRNLFH